MNQRKDIQVQGEARENRRPGLKPVHAKQKQIIHWQKLELQKKAAELQHKATES